VIVRADNEKLSGRSDLAHILQNHREGGKITLGVVRDKHEQTFVVVLPDRGSRDSSYMEQHSFGFDSEGLRASLGELRGLAKELESIKDLDSLEIDIPSLDLEDAGQQILELTPETEKAMHQAEQKMRHAQELLEKQQHEFKFDFDPFI